MPNPRDLSDEELTRASVTADAVMVRQVKRVRLADRRFNAALSWSLALDDENERRRPQDA